MPLSDFADDYRAELEARLASPEWQAALPLVEAARGEVLTPPATANVFALPVSQLEAINGASVRDLISTGERDSDRLLAALGAWPNPWPNDLPVRLSFVGLNLGFACDMEPRCRYCNQVPTAEALSGEDWKALLTSLAPAEGDGPYVYLTGGEPLMLGETLWGTDGIIATATRARAACNLNTNALQLTPEAALGLVRSGLGRIHISLDTHRREVQDDICQSPGRWDAVVQGLANLQLAKVFLDVNHPVIHINCVLTRQNADDFPEFLRFLLARKPLCEADVSGDLNVHVIPVGGERNRDLRLTDAGYRQFFSETWNAADAIYREYQAARGVPEDKRGALHEKLPYCSPFHRVAQRGGLEDWAACAAQGRPADLAVASRCYVSPTQAFILPDGSQYWCGGHSVSRPAPVGNVLEHSVQDNIHAAMAQHAALPTDSCRNCPGATLAINQEVERRLLALIAEWIAAADAVRPAADVLPIPSSEGAGE